jgi:hypothetical protein
LFSVSCFLDILALIEVRVCGYDCWRRSERITRLRRPCSCGCRTPEISARSYRNVSWTYRCDPFFAAALNSRPIEVPDLGAALFIRADDFASNSSALEDRFHPSQLRRQPKYHLMRTSKLTGSTKYPEHFGLTRIAGPAFGSDPNAETSLALLPFRSLARLLPLASVGVMANIDIRRAALWTP